MGFNSMFKGLTVFCNYGKKIPYAKREKFYTNSALLLDRLQNLITRSAAVRSSEYAISLWGHKRAVIQFLSAGQKT
jgi:hypothetical protein